MKGEWKHSSLGAIAPFSGDRVSLMELSVENYVSTDTLLPNRAGRELANGLPPFQGNIPAYKCGDILISNIRPYLKKIWIADSYGGCSADVLIFRAEKDIDSKFLFYILSQDHFFEYMMGSSKGSKMPRGDKSVIEKYPVCIPAAFTDQQHIADILTSCDEVIEQTEKAIAKYRDIKAGMLQDLFTRGVDANGKLRPKPEDAPQLYKDSPLGKIPKEWEIKTIGDLFDVEIGGDLQKDCFLSYKTVSHQYPIYSNSLENNGLYGYTTAPNYPAESITLTGRGSLGHAEHRKEPFDAIIRLVVLKVKKDQRVDCKFITEQINYDQDFFIESTGVPQLTAPQSAKMRVRMPKIETEQSNIAQHISAIDEKIELEEKTLAKYRSIKLGLMKKLLTPPEGALEA